MIFRDIQLSVLNQSPSFILKNINRNRLLLEDDVRHHLPFRWDFQIITYPGTIIKVTIQQTVERLHTEVMKKEQFHVSICHHQLSVGLSLNTATPSTFLCFSIQGQSQNQSKEIDTADLMAFHLSQEASILRFSGGDHLHELPINVIWQGRIWLLCFSHSIYVSNQDQTHNSIAFSNLSSALTTQT